MIDLRVAQRVAQLGERASWQHKHREQQHGVHWATLEAAQQGKGLPATDTEEEQGVLCCETGQGVPLMHAGQAGREGPWWPWHSAASEQSALMQAHEGLPS